MEINKKKWIIIGGTLSTFALAPLAAATGPSVFNDPTGGSGVVVAAATTGPTDQATAEPTADPSGTNTVSPASPETPNDAQEPVSPVTANTPLTPITPRSPVSPKSPS